MTASTAAVTIVAYAAGSPGIGHAVLGLPGTTQTAGGSTTAKDVATVTGRRVNVAVTPPPGSLALTAHDYSKCSSAAAACVDLARHLTWLQSGGKVSFGPVRMEPGQPGTASATPPGTFTVVWKGGPDVISSTYAEPMPWAVSFGPDGIAFHAGSLTAPSHGCVHLTMANARYYNAHLAIGARVVVF